ncbi:C-type lectin domain-containing protein, partial [Trichostrongylus colubriformis]
NIKLPFQHVNAASTWFEAVAGCRAKRAELVSIHSIGENECVYKLVASQEKDLLNRNRTVWIGAYQRTNSLSSSFEWIDGTSFSFTYWARNEPKNKEGKENCASIYHRPIDGWNESGYIRHWNAIPCDKQLRDGYVCKQRSNKVINALLKSNLRQGSSSVRRRSP